MYMHETTSYRDLEYYASFYLHNYALWYYVFSCNNNVHSDKYFGLYYVPPIDQVFQLVAYPSCCVC